MVGLSHSPHAIVTGAARGIGREIASTLTKAGAVVTALLLLYPHLPMSRIVGSDIAHAVPLTLTAGAGHWAMGAVDWQLMGVLLIGSLPGIVIGSYCAVRVPETALRLMLAAILVLVAGRLGSEQWRSATPNLASVSTQAPAAAPPIPITVGVPEISPVPVFTDSVPGRPVALKLVGLFVPVI